MRAVESNDTKWYHLSVCRGMSLNWFYDEYEADQELAKTMDGICAACPVRKICFDEGTRNQEHGLWGGFFLSNGKIDPQRNEHKNETEWLWLA